MRSKESLKELQILESPPASLTAKLQRLAEIYFEILNPPSRQIIDGEDVEQLDDGVRLVPRWAATPEEIAADTSPEELRAGMITVSTEPVEPFSEAEMLGLVRDLKAEWKEHFGEDISERIFETPTELREFFGILKEPKVQLAESKIRDSLNRLDWRLKNPRRKRAFTLTFDGKLLTRTDLADSRQVKLTPTELALTQKVYESDTITRQELEDFLLHRNRQKGGGSSDYYDAQKNLDTHKSNINKKLHDLGLKLQSEASIVSITIISDE